MRNFWIYVCAASLVGCEVVDSGESGETGDDTGSPPGGGDDDDDDDGPAGVLSCTTGELFAGDPLFADPSLRPDEGAGLLEGPPLGSRNVLFAGDLLLTHAGQELWRSDLSAASPVWDRFAGQESLGQSLRTGACDQARFANLFGMALAPDGTMYVSDQTANAVLQVTDPLGPSCAVHHFAGSSEDYPELSPASVPNVGDRDGAGARAQFAGVERIAVSADGEVFAWDLGNASIRKIANDAEHTVSPLATGIDGNVQALVVMDGKLYLWGNGNELYLTEIDPADGTSRTVLSGRGELFGGDSSSPLFVGGMVADGEDLVLYFNGQLFRVTVDGDVKRLAGTGEYFEFTAGYDPAAEHPVDQLELVSRGQVATAGANLWLGLDGAHGVYMSGRVNSSYIEKVSCQR